MHSAPTNLLGFEVPSLFVLPLLVVIPFILFNASTLFGVGKDKHGNPKQANEFGGPLGSFGITFALPAICYWLYFSCNTNDIVSLNPFSSHFLNYKINPFHDGFAGFIHLVWDPKVFLIFTIWVIFHWLLYLLIPGEIVDGTPLRAPFQNVRLPYKINALTCHLFTLALLTALVYFDVISGSFGYDYFLQLLTSAVVFSFIMSIALYIHSRITIPDDDAQNLSPLHLLSHSGNGGNVFYDFWMGRTLNPRIGFLDLKYVCELRPGLILWSVLNFSMAYKQYETYGYVTPSMILVCLFEWYYVLDSHLNEKAILTTMDITTDGFGLMLVFGDLTWVPFTYTMQSRYLADHPLDLSVIHILFIIGVKLAGLYIFRSSNNQKNHFRRNPDGQESKDIKYITTASGRRLMTSGWWEIARHINYLGDILMALSWSLCTGFNTPFTYFYPIYFTILLIHRDRRDEHKCRLQYGKDWDRYCEIVPYRIFPGIY